MKHKRILRGAIIGIALLTMGIGTSVSAQNVTQGYKPSGDLQNGMIVRFKPSEPGTVEALDQKNELSMLGITVASSDSPVSLSDPNQSQIFVATYGEYDTLVSTQNGPIKAGDRISISSVNGVGMKADDQHRVILGKAMQNFADSSNAEEHIKLGGGQTVAVGRIVVDVGVARNPAYIGDITPGVPVFLAKAARAVSGRSVTALRIYAGLGVLVLALIIAGIILFGGARSGMNAVGRNPLAKKSIFRSMVTVVLMALIVVVLGIFALYLLLKI